VWLVLFLGTFHTWHYLLISVWKSVLLGDCPVISPTTHCSWCLFKFNSSLVLLAEGPCMSVFAYWCHKLVQALWTVVQISVWSTALPIHSVVTLMTCCTIMVGHLHEGFVAAPNQFWDDRVIAQSFNRSLAIWKNVDVPVPIVPIQILIHACLNGTLLPGILWCTAQGWN
jgi:hypothetical protein